MHPLLEKILDPPMHTVLCLNQMSRQCPDLLNNKKVELIQLGSAHVATSIYGMRKKIETLNSVNRHKRRVLHVSFHLTPPLTSSKFLPSGAWGPGETKMAPYGDSTLVQLTSNESTDSVRTQLGLSLQ